MADQLPEERSPQTASADSPGLFGGLLGGRQAARIRAVVRADLLPHERAAADALVMTAWLTRAQREQYRGALRARDDAEDFAQALADERRVVLEEGAEPVPGEEESAQEAEHAAGQLPLRLVEAALLLLALGLFAGIIWTVRTAPDGANPDAAYRMLAFLGSCILAIVLAGVVGRIATRRRDRMLLDWAVSRPGQLGRGLPLRRPLQSESLGPAVARIMGVILLVPLGVLGIVGGAGLLLISLLDREQEALLMPGVAGLVGGAVAIVLTVLLQFLRARRLMTIIRRGRAAEWIGSEPAEEEPSPL